MKRALLACLLLVLAVCESAAAQDRPGSAPRDTLPWNEADFGWTTFRFGAGLLVDYAAFAQDDDSKEQVRLNPGFKLRDARVLFRGRFRGRRGITWQTGIMYDEPTNTLRFRQTGFMFPLDGDWGRIFIGRQKEGVSSNKIMVGYYGWTMERFTFSDAAIPILADGVRWFGYASKPHLFWSVGAFADWWAEVESFSKDEHIYAGRIGWVSNPADSAASLLHVAANVRVGHPNEDTIRFRSRPEAFRANFFVDTGSFPATQTVLVGPEVYYRAGRLLAGSEYYWVKADSPETGDPAFHGGDVFVAWLLNPATRPYQPYGGFFGMVTPERGILDGGPGAWELVLRFSYIDLDDAEIEGGKFWRITPMANWHLGNRLRLEFGYGYGVLDRFDLTGGTHFFQNRIQLQF